MKRISDELYAAIVKLSKCYPMRASMDGIACTLCCIKGTKDFVSDPYNHAHDCPWRVAKEVI